MELKDIVHQGWLYKQSRYLKRWKRRWVVMSKANINTYKNQDMKSKPTETIPLQFCKGVKSAEDETKKEYSFRVDLGDTVFFFHADNTEQKEKWIGVISRQMINPDNLNHSSEEEDNDTTSSEED